MILRAGKLSLRAEREPRFMGAIAPGVEGCIYNLGKSPTQQRRSNTEKMEMKRRGRWEINGDK